MPGVLQIMGLQRVRHYWATEHQQHGFFQIKYGNDVILGWDQVEIHFQVDEVKHTWQGIQLHEKFFEAKEFSAHLAPFITKWNQEFEIFNKFPIFLYVSQCTE